MKKFLLLLTSLVLIGTMMARPLTPDEALAQALGKMNAVQPERTRAVSTAARASLTHTELDGQDVPLYYVFDLTEGGFILASADDKAPVLLGYTDSGDFACAQQNQTFQAWLKDCRMALTRLGNGSETTRSASAVTRALTTPVLPLLGDITWNQKEPYNLLTPLRVGRKDAEAEPDTVHAPTGCPATAVAQVMMYYQWPVTGTGSHTNANAPEQTVDFSQSTYQWSKMLPTYVGGESEESQQAVAKLMYDLGCAMDMIYGYRGSGANDPDPLTALTTYFGYDKRMRLVYRTECSSEQWNALLMTELNEQRPVIFCASGAGGGHQFVIDGCDENGLYHVNWGWSGKADGYFDINLMEPKYLGTGGFEGGFTLQQTMIIGVRPDVEGTSVAQPGLVLFRNLWFDEDIQQWSYWVRNHGLGDFSGEIGIAMESPAGEVTRLSTDKFDAEPIVFYDRYEYLFDTPDATAPGYKLYPYYSDEVGGEIKRLPLPYNGLTALYSVEKEGEYSWAPDVTEIADIEIVNVEVTQHSVGSDPQISITLHNAATALKEYAEDLYVEMTTLVDGAEELVGYKLAQAFVSPGETKEIAVKFNQIEKDFQGKITEGEYYYIIYCNLGGRYEYLGEGSFMMVDVPPTGITSPDVTVSKPALLFDAHDRRLLIRHNGQEYDVMGRVIQRF